MQRPVGIRLIALTGLFILAVFNAVCLVGSILQPIESKVSRYFFTITAINAWLDWPSKPRWDCSVCVTRCIALMERCSPLAARCALSAKSVVPKLILFGRRVPVDSHGAGGGRNCTDPVTWHRNAGCCSERVAHFLRGLHDPLWMCRRHYVLARISSKCRCAKCEREHDTRPSNRRTTLATEPVFDSHAVIVIPFRILASSFRGYSRQRNDTFSIANQSFQKYSVHRRRRFALGNCLLLWVHRTLKARAA
jgi:hypothetical protein